MAVTVAIRDHPLVSRPAIGFPENLGDTVFVK